jgi:hypothetical protein
MMGDWMMLTSGMRADAKGVFIGLLIHQYHHGSLPSSLEELALIEPQVGSVWVSLEKHLPELSTGLRANPELEETRAFWNKQAKNGLLGGRPKRKTQTEPKQEPRSNPNGNPNPNLHTDLDLDNDLEEKKGELGDWDRWGDQIVQEADQYWEQMRGRKVGRQEMNEFLSVAVRNDWRMETQQQFRTSLNGFKSTDKPKVNGNHASKKQHEIDNLITDYVLRNAGDNPGNDRGQPARGDGAGIPPDDRGPAQW